MITFNSIFRAAWHHFILMDSNPSVNHNGNCMYRGLNGTMCAVGLVLPDKVAVKLEMMSFQQVVEENKELFDLDVCKMVGRNRLQYELHDGIINLYKTDWTYPRMERMDIYVRYANDNQLDVSFMNEKKYYTRAEAQAIVDKLSFGEADGWMYKMKTHDDVSFWVEVYDDKGVFVSYWNP